MQKYPTLTKKRLQRFKEDKHLGGTIYGDRKPVKLSMFAAPGRIRYDEAMQGDYQPVEVGYHFGPLWATFWVRVEMHIPAAWAEQEVHFLWDSTSEATIWQDGQPLQGLSGSTYQNLPWDAIRQEYILTDAAQGGEQITFYVEVACNHLFGTVPGTPTEKAIGKLERAEIAVFNRDAWDLYWDYCVIADMAEHLPDHTPRQGQALRVANTMTDIIRMDDKATWQAARVLAAEFFAQHGGDAPHNISATGMAHIDTAWLWPLEETKRKCVRTFATAIAYMDRYPEYIFTVSQAQQLQWMKDEYPDLYARIKEKFAAGQFIPTGGTWVEPDCNIPSGESFVRQFLFGQRFFEREFGLHCNDFWEPDVFGYSAALPQIMQLCEIDMFLTQKLSWNQFNDPPSHTFLWEGLDGSQVLTHFPPLNTYNAEASIEQIIQNVHNYKDHESSQESYFLFGLGDGGGGPTPDMIERLLRIKDVDGLPRVEMRTPQDFYQRLKADLKDPIKWVGELYLEYHRATYTTQALTKKLNRHSEFALHDVEFLGVLAAIEGSEYPAEALDTMWKTVLKNQFHDILPGSSIEIVHDESEAEYQAVVDEAGTLRDHLIDGLWSSEGGENVLAINATGFAREDVITQPDDGTLAVVNTPAYGYAIGTQIPFDQSVSLTETSDGTILENTYLKATITKGGIVTSLIEKETGREAIADGGKGNQFVIFEDRPCNYDAWDVDIYHLNTREEVPAAHTYTITEDHPLRAAVSFDTSITANSTIRQTISLDACSRSLMFDTQVDWHESERFLKVEFPFAVRAMEATYEIQFGHVKRPTHFNTSWDFARFEVCGHKWADISEHGFGVALLNDCKYGYSTLDNVMRLSLVRGPSYPDPTADRGEHTFRYAVMPHAGSFQEAGVIAEGYRLNAPLHVRRTDAMPTSKSYFIVDNPAVVIDGIKQAEDGDHIIVRMYESFGSHADVTVDCGLPVESAATCNLLERQDAPVAVIDGAIKLSFTPFQIQTLKLAINHE